MKYIRTKMSKELEALKYLKDNKRRHWLDNDNSSECLDLIEIALKELNDIKSGKIRLSVKSGENYVAVPKYQYEQDTKKFKAFEIIKEKQVEIERFVMLAEGLPRKKALRQYNKWVEKWKQLTQEEYDLLVEALLWHIKNWYTYSQNIISL